MNHFIDNYVVECRRHSLSGQFVGFLELELFLYKKRKDSKLKNLFKKRKFSDNLEYQKCTRIFWLVHLLGFFIYSSN